MKKTYLIKYELKYIFGFYENSDYYLFYETVWFWGLFKTHNKKTYRLWHDEYFKTFFDHWDNLIKTKKTIK